MGRATALGADLHDAVVLAGGVEHGEAFGDVDGDRLLAVDVSAGLAGFDEGEGVPVVGGGDENDVEVLFLEHLAVVGVEAGPFLGGLAFDDHVGAVAEHGLVDVAEGDDFDGGDLEEAEEVALAVPAGADEADAAGLLLAVGSEGGGAQR